MVEAGWESFLKKLQKIKPMLPSQLQMAQIDSVKGNVIHLVFFSSGESCKDIIARQDNFSLILQMAQDHFESNLSIKLSVDHEKQASDSQTDKEQGPSHRIKEIIANSSRLKLVIDKVDGEVIAIRDTE